MREKLATRVATYYWFSVVGTYVLALILHDDLGLAFIPFVLLALPWSLLVWGLLVLGLPEHTPAIAVKVAMGAVLCFLFSGGNALLIYRLIAGHWAELSKILRRRPK
jgi:hypothetical protein